jgi:methylphosphotriester-DNA--protein-cysteine methyltransferase
MTADAKKCRWRLIGADGRTYDSDRPGTLGGHRRSRIYGRLDCRAALRALAGGRYRRDRVFFADEAVALAAGYRPCGVCMPDDYARWKADRPAARSSRSRAR